MLARKGKWVFASVSSHHPCLGTYHERNGYRLVGGDTCELDAHGALDLLGRSRMCPGLRMSVVAPAPGPSPPCAARPTCLGQ